MRHKTNLKSSHLTKSSKQSAMRKKLEIKKIPINGEVHQFQGKIWYMNPKCNKPNKFNGYTNTG